MVRASGGFFAVRDDRGEVTLCRARGKLKKEKLAPLVGDRVSFSPREKVIEKIHPRRTCLLRPPVANVDQVVVVLSICNPPPDWFLATRLLVQVEQQGMEGIICITKIDLADAEMLAETRQVVKAFPYRHLFTAKGRENRELKAALKDRCSVFAGPSGVGKSTLLNSLQPDFDLETGEVSPRLGRGRHTTRAAMLLPLKEGGLVVDTPGFTRLWVEKLEAAELSALFPEMASLAGKCAFRNCTHRREPDCAVREAVAQEVVHPLRYQHYLLLYEELEEQEKKR